MDNKWIKWSTTEEQREKFHGKSLRTVWWSNPQRGFLHFSMCLLSLLHRKCHPLHFSPQLTSSPPITRFRIPSGHSRTPLNFTQGAPAQESSTHSNKNLWHKTATISLEGHPCASPSPMTFRLAILLTPDAKTQATSMTVNFFKGSRHWLSLLLQWMLKVDIVFISSKSQTKLNHFAWTGQLANCEYFPFYSIITCPCALVLSKAEMLQWYHMLVPKLYSGIFIKNNFCLHSTTTKKPHN